MSEMFKYAIQGFEELEAVSGSNAKIEILKKYKDNKSFTEMLVYCYHSQKMFFMKQVPESVYSSQDKWDWSNFKEVLDKLATRTVTGNAARELVMGALSHYTQNTSKWLCKVLQKDLKVGITEKTINKVYGKNFIPEYSCILAQTFKTNSISKLPKFVVEEPKLDGYRINLYNEKSGAYMKTRNGKFVYGYDEICKQAHELLEHDFVYDSEILAAALSDNDLSRVEGFSSIQKSAFKKADGKSGVLNIFDKVPLKSFIEQDGSKTNCQADRKASLKSNFELIKSETHSALAFVPNSKVYDTTNPDDWQEIQELYSEYLDAGFEGAMLKDIEAPYEFKRTNALWKLKPVETIDLEVTGMMPGKPGTKYENTLGKLVVNYKGFEVRVAGIPDKLREEWWNDPTRIVGKTIEIWYQDESKNQDGGLSLRFPRYKCTRNDK